MRGADKRLYAVGALFGIWVFYAINNYFVIFGSRYVLGNDGMSYFSNLLEAFRVLKRISLDIGWVGDFCGTLFGFWKPPLFYLTGAFTLLFGIDRNIVTLLNNQIYFAILLFGTYGAARRLGGDTTEGLLAAFLVSMFPTTFALSRILMPDFALAAMVSLSFYLFLLNKFGRMKFSIICGIVFGLGFLTKQTYAVYFLLLLAHSVIKNYKDGKFKDRTFLVNFVLSLLVGLWLAVPWYIRDENLFFKTYYILAFGIRDNADISFFYLKHMLRPQMGLVFFSLFAGSFVFSLHKRRFSLPLITTCILAVLSIFNNREERFILPVFIFIALMISQSVSSLGKVRRVAVAAMVLFGLAGYLSISYRGSSYGFYDKLAIDEKGLYCVLDKGNFQSPASEVLRVIQDRMALGGEKSGVPLKVLYLSGTGAKNAIKYAAGVEGIRIDSHEVSPDQFFLRYPSKYEINYDEYINQFDFIIREENIEKHYIHARHLTEAFENNRRSFDLITEISFPVRPDSGITVRVFQKI